MDRLMVNELEAVLAIARRGSFRAASVDLDVSPTALSHAIRKLEADLGVRLFNRTTRSVSLTEAGRILTERVGPSLLDVRDALDAVRSLRSTPSGTIRINAATFAGREIMSRVVVEFLRRYPDMKVDIVTEGRLIDVVAHGFDLGVRVAGLVPSDMIAIPLGRPQRFAVVGSKRYFDKHGSPRVPGDLARHRCIRVRLPDGSIFRWRFEKDGQIIEVDVDGQITLDEGSLARIAVKQDIGLGFFLEQDVIEDISRCEVVRVLDDWTPSFPGLALYYPSRRNLSAGLKAFLALTREMAGEGGSR